MTLPRFYPILDTTWLGGRGMRLEDAARALVDAGCRILQFRHKGAYGAAEFEAAARVGDIVHKAGACFVVNDRVDVALMVGAGRRSTSARTTCRRRPSASSPATASSSATPRTTESN